MKTKEIGLGGFQPKGVVLPPQGPRLGFSSAFRDFVFPKIISLLSKPQFVSHLPGRAFIFDLGDYARLDMQKKGIFLLKLDQKILAGLNADPKKGLGLIADAVRSFKERKKLLEGLFGSILIRRYIDGEKKRNAGESALEKSLVRILLSGNPVVRALIKKAEEELRSEAEKREKFIVLAEKVLLTYKARNEEMKDELVPALPEFADPNYPGYFCLRQFLASALTRLNYDYDKTEEEPSSPVKARALELHFMPVYIIVRALQLAM